MESGLLIRSVLGDERRRVIFADLVQSGSFVLQRDAEMGVRDGNELRPKRRRDELRLILRSMSLLFDQRRDGRSMSSIQRRINLVKEIKRSRVAALDREDLRESDQSLLPSRELVHLTDVIITSWKSDLDLHASERSTGTRRC